ncbi:M23 family metallopeptidase [Rheinheimera baltica]|uniref:M23 family metallopeptidase n=1 Tax=Rheinheimera baltica TaxID=67576 RepID=UPI000A06C3A0
MILVTLLANNHICIIPYYLLFLFRGSQRWKARLGPKWRIHYYAHLNQNNVAFGDFVNINTQIATLGDTGNAAGKQPHLHYSILSIIPIPWLATMESQGWKKMFFLSPHKKLL